jgi:hypothetical protein
MGGTSWVNISGTLPNVEIRSIVYDTPGSDNIYIGTDLGVFYRDSSINSWEVLNGNLPNLVVTDIEVNMTQNKLVVATYGRGIWQKWN